MLCYFDSKGVMYATAMNGGVSFYFSSIPISDSLFCYLLHVLPVQKTTIISRESEIILLTARYEDWSALARKTQTQTQRPTQKALYTDTNANTSTLKYILVYIIMRRTKWIFWRSNFLTAESGAEVSSLCPCSYFTRGKAEK